MQFLSSFYLFYLFRLNESFLRLVIHTSRCFQPKELKVLYSKACAYVIMKIIKLFSADWLRVENAVKRKAPNLKVEG